MKVVIVGGGYASLSAAEEIRRLEASNNTNNSSQITIFSSPPHSQGEEFCSRPNVFFRFKFPTKDDVMYGFKDASFYEKKNIALRREHVTKINVDEQLIITEEGTEERYDKLIIATGGSPRWVPFTTSTSSCVGNQVPNMHLLFTEGKGQTSLSLQSGLVRSVLQRHAAPTNMFTIRNADEANLLHSYIMHVYNRRDEQYTQDNSIVIVGGGTLALDLISSTLEGYESILRPKPLVVPKRRAQQQPPPEQPVADKDALKYLPRIILVVRGDILAGPLLDTQSSRMFTDFVNNFRIDGHQILQVMYSSQVQEVVVNEHDWVTKVVVSQAAGDSAVSSQSISCSCVIQAVGVALNPSVVSSTDVLYGPNQGIVVNSKFNVISQNRPLENVFAIGDCAEIPDYLLTVATQGKLSSSVWKNWTAAREQAVECAKSILDLKPEVLVFNQTSRLFGLYIACLGHYKIEESTDRVLVVRADPDQADPMRYVKLVLSKNVDDAGSVSGYILAGALVVGNTNAEFTLGLEILKVMKLLREIPSQPDYTPERFASKDFRWGDLLKHLKQLPPSNNNDACLLATKLDSLRI